MVARVHGFQGGNGVAEARAGRTSTGAHGSRFSDPMSVRVLKLLLAIYRSGDVGRTTAQLRKVLNCSKATLYRHLAVIRASEWPLLVEHDPADSMRARYRIAPLKPRKA